jgi:hypothetical protein
MNIFKHTGSGHYIGSCVIVTAPNLKRASEIIRGYLNDSGLKDELLNITEYNCDRVSIIHAVNGDY